MNCIAPSLTNSKIAQPMLKNSAVADGIAKAHPLKRIGEGQDSASLAKFLITEDSSWVTGQNIAVDGGHTLRRAPDLEPAIRARLGDEEFSKLSKPGSGPNGYDLLNSSRGFKSHFSSMDSCFSIGV